MGEAGPFEFVAALFKHSYCKCEAFPYLHSGAVCQQWLCTVMEMTTGPHRAAVMDIHTSAMEDIMILSGGRHANCIAGI